MDDLVTAACKLAKLRNSATLEARDLQMVLERQYNIRIPGFSTDEVRTVKKVQPAQGWAAEDECCSGGQVDWWERQRLGISRR